MRIVKKSHKLDNVCYDIRGPVLREARRMEEDGHKIIKLNIGNPSPFGFDAPEEIVQDMIHNVPESQGYSDSRGLYSGRKAVMQYCQQKNIGDVEIDDIYLGNGVSELIVMAMQALLNNGDEVLIPAPDYPLWTASVSLCGGNPVHYLCDEQADWYPDIDDLAKKITKKTRGIVLINPNNPTGALYPPVGMVQVRGLPQGGEGVQQIEDLGDVGKLLGQVVPTGFPERVLPVHEQDDRVLARGVALRHLLGHPSEDRLNLRLGRVHGIALQGGADVLEAGPGA